MQLTDAIYGVAPEVIGKAALKPSEMMFWLYCPISIAGFSSYVLPDNLEQFQPILDIVRADCPDEWIEKNVYLTAKTLWVTPENPGNRPGWHSDGFLTDDTNYIWYDSIATVFYCDGELHAFTAEHDASMKEMHALCEGSDRYYIRYEPGYILRLPQTVLHKSEDSFVPQMRTFLKVSLSSEKYRHEGNSINHKLALDWASVPRSTARNCPATLETTP